MERDLILLVCGALASLGATALVQLGVVPHVESRKRLEDRWESDVRDLGRLLHFEFADAKAEMSTTLLLSVFISARRTDLTPKELLSLRNDQAERSRMSRLTLARANDQVLWLVDQVFLPDERAGAFGPLSAASTRFVTAMSLILDMS